MSSRRKETKFGPCPPAFQTTSSNREQCGHVAHISQALPSMSTLAEAASLLAEGYAISRKLLNLAEIAGNEETKRKLVEEERKLMDVARRSEKVLEQVRELDERIARKKQEGESSEVFQERRKSDYSLSSPQIFGERGGERR